MSRLKRYRDADRRKLKTNSPQIKLIMSNNLTKERGGGKKHMNHIFFAALIHNKSANTGDTTTIFYRHKRICAPSFSSVLNEGAQERMLRFVHSFIHSLRLNTSPRTVFLKSHEWKQQPEARNSLLGCFCQMCAAALEPIVPLLRIAAARSPLTPRGLSSEQPAATNTHTGTTEWHGAGEPGTHSCSDRRQLHEPVRTDGADVPGCAGGRVRRGDPRSNQQPGIHSRSTAR